MKKEESTLDKTIFYTPKEFVNKFGSQYEKTIEFALICKDEALFNHYKNANVITIKNSHGEEKTVSEDLIVDLINNTYGMYSYLINNLNNQLGIAVKMCYFDSEGNLVDNIVITLAELKLFLNKVDSNRIDTLAFSPLISSITSYKKLQKTYASVTREFVLDNEIITENISNLIKVLLLSDEDFYAFAHETKVARKTFYMLVEFMETERILDKYVLPVNIHQRYLDIKEGKIVDIETINSDIKAQDPDSIDNKIINELQIDEGMILYVIKYLKTTYSGIEIAIHLYIRLCELISKKPYEFSGEISDDIKTQDGDDDIELNYHYFRLIYAALLKKFNINYNTQKNTFVVGEYKILVDKANVDLKNISIEDTINNLKCINSLQITRLKFEELFNRVLDNILDREVKEEKFIVANEKYERCNYEKINNNSLNDEEKVEIIVQAIMQSDLSLYDSIDYQKKVLKLADDMIASTFINTPEGFKTIIRITQNDIDYYYLLDPRNKESIKRISYEELQELFNKGEYSYIANSSDTIRGI